MRRTFWTALVLLSFTPLFSQKVYFIYIQSESKQPFFVRLDNKLLSSSASGYLILSRLRDTVYSIGLGFPGGKQPEQRYRLSVDKKDHGYLLKDFGGRGWGLFDLQTLSVQYADTSYGWESRTTPEEANEVSAFTDILSKAADDPTLREKRRPEPSKTDSVIIGKMEAPPVAMDTVVVVKTEVVQPVAEQQVVTEVQVTAPVDGEAKVNATAANPYRPSKVTRFAELTTTEGVGLVFIDAIAEGQVDTVRLIIPEPPVALQPAADAKDTVVVLSPLERPYGDSVKKADAGEPVVEERKVEPVKVVPVDTRSVRTNNCPAVADEADFLKLRKKMAATRTDDAMLEEARRYFKDRCFTVGQIRNLSALFLTDEGKYRFFDVSYPYASDLGSFSGLQEELRDPYYINRFRAMLR